MCLGKSKAAASLRSGAVMRQRHAPIIKPTAQAEQAGRQLSNSQRRTLGLAVLPALPNSQTSSLIAQDASAADTLEEDKRKFTDYLKIRSSMLDIVKAKELQETAKRMEKKAVILEKAAAAAASAAHTADNMAVEKTELADNDPADRNARRISEAAMQGKIAAIKEMKIQNARAEEARMKADAIAEEVVKARKQADIAARKLEESGISRESLKNPYWKAKIAEWKADDAFFRKENHVYESVTEKAIPKSGKKVVGSVYFGTGDGSRGGRLRLLHGHGPEVERFNHVERFYGKRGTQIDPQKLRQTHSEGERIYEWLDGGTYTHQSRGFAENMIGDDYSESDYEELLHGVEFAQMIARGESLMPKQDKIPGEPERANSFLAHYMQEKNLLKGDFLLS